MRSLAILRLFGPLGIVTRLRHTIFRTFQGRLALLYIAIEFGILMFAGVVLYAALALQINHDVDDRLREQAASVVRELEQSPDSFWGGILQSFAEHYPGAVQLITANGAIRFRSDRALIDRGGGEVSHALLQAFNHDRVSYASTESLLKRSNMRVIVMPVHRGGRVVATLVLGRSTADIRAVFNLLYVIGGLLGLISIVISAAAGYYMAKKAMQPIREIISTARAVAAGDLSRRLSSKSEDKEIQQMVRVLNKMFGDLEASFQAQKRFIADASHELRLPLTILKGEIEVALRQPRSEEEYVALLRQQLETVERMQRIVNDLLMLARADAGQMELEQKPVDLSLLVEEVGQQHLMLFDAHHVRLEIDVEDGLEVNGDAAHLERMLMNLLNNAFNHAPEGSRVWLRLYA
ncbi:MAG: histidine kinase dimerization/phospho-acceptor domain-containing protein, partial [Mariprofundaceae bacterium]